MACSTCTSIELLLIARLRRHQKGWDAQYCQGENCDASSTFKNYEATLAIDGDVHTFSHTNDDNAWLQIDLVKMYRINSVNFINRWCNNPNDSPGCLCRLSNARISLLDGSGSVVVTRPIGDTCHLKEFPVEFDSDCPTATLVSYLSVVIEICVLFFFSEL